MQARRHINYFGQSGGVTEKVETLRDMTTNSSVFFFVDPSDRVYGTNYVKGWRKVESFTFKVNVVGNV